MDQRAAQAGREHPRRERLAVPRRLVPRRTLAQLVEDAGDKTAASPQQVTAAQVAALTATLVAAQSGASAKARRRRLDPVGAKDVVRPGDPGLDDATRFVVASGRRPDARIGQRFNVSRRVSSGRDHISLWRLGLMARLRCRWAPGERAGEMSRRRPSTHWSSVRSFRPAAQAGGCSSTSANFGLGWSAKDERHHSGNLPDRLVCRY